MNHFILSAFADEISSHLDEQITVLKQNGIQHVEFRGLEDRVIIDYTLEEVREIARKLAGEGIAVSALGSPIGKIMITDPFPPHLERFKKTIEVAQLLGTTNIRMFSFFIPFDEDPSHHRSEVIHRWQSFLSVSEGSGLNLLHENEKAIYGDTPERCLDLIAALDHLRVRAIFDPANFVQCGVETYPHAYNLLADQIVYMHIKDAIAQSGEVVPSGQGDGHLPEILGALAQKGYQGFLSIEPHLNNSFPGGGPEKFAIAANALKSILSTL
jgi:L-ribulose-5-phosphate 3-epimerase